MWKALQLCLPVTLMTFAIFVRSELVVRPGWKQIEDTLIVAIACGGVAFALFGRMLSTRKWDVMLRTVLAFLSLVVMLYPNDNVALGAAVVVMLATFYGTYRHRLICREKRAPA